MRITRLAQLVSAALLALALTASPASAAVLDANGDPYVTPDDIISGSTASATLNNGLINITCAGTFAATLDNGDADADTGTEPDAGITELTFQSCSPSATFTVNNLPYSFHVTETTVTITADDVEAHMDAVSFTCTLSATANEITGDVDWNADTITFDETLTMSGTGCGTQVNWTFVQAFTPDLHWG